MAPAGSATVRRPAAGPGVATSSLVPQQRPPRAPLDAWAEDLLARLAACRGQFRAPRVFALNLSGVANNAALVAAHHGAVEVARRLCEGQIRWHGRFSRRAGDPALAAHGLQPWINLGRLEALEGRWEPAVRRFAQLPAYRGGIPVSAGRVRVRCAGWEAVSGSAAEFAAWLDQVYAHDTLKALLQGGELERVLAFRAGLGPVPVPADARLLDEVCVVAHGRLGDWDAAEELARGAASAARGWERAAFRVRLAEALAGGGWKDDALALLLADSEVVGRVSPATLADPEKLHLVLRMAALCRALGHEEAALARARDVYAGGRASGEESFRIEGLRLLAVLAPAEERGRWREELEEMEETTLYARFRRGGPPPPHPLLERLFGEVDEALDD